jgi:hypothetical protein
MVISLKFKYKKDIYIDFKIDVEDLHYVEGKKFTAVIRGDKFYLYSRSQNKYAHRLIMGEPRDGLVVDHIDGDTTNNSKSNLRVTTPANNSANQKIPKNNKSGYKGVSFDKENKKWRAKLGYQGKQQDLGRHLDPIQAAEAYNKKALELWGEYALLNIIK